MPATHTLDLEAPESARDGDDVDPAGTGLGGVTDDVVDLTDRRRVLLRIVFGVDANPQEVDLVFASPEDD